MKPTLLIMAAGMGSRYGGLKQIDPVGPNGEIIIDYSMFDAVQAGYGKMVFVIRHFFQDAFREKIGSKFEGVIDTAYAYQELDTGLDGYEPPAEREKPWGTGHAILTAASVINEPFAVINADDFYGPQSMRIMAEYLSQPAPADGAEEYAMIGFILRNTLSDHGKVARGVCHVDENCFLRDVNETLGIERDGDGARYPEGDGYGKLTGDEIASMNLWGFRPSVFDHLKKQFARFLEERGHELKSEFFIPTVVDNLIKSGQIRARTLITPDSWFGVTYREDKPLAQQRVRELIEEGVYPENLWNSARLRG